MDSSTLWYIEKHAVVLNFGHAYSKIGIAGEHNPRCITYTPQLFLEKSIEKSLFVKYDTVKEEDWQYVLEKIIRQFYFGHLNVTPKDRKVVVCDWLMTTKAFRDALLKVLFDQLEVSSVIFLADMVAPLYTCGISSGLVVDVGYLETRVVPTLYGMTDFLLYRYMEVGGRHVDERLKKFLKDNIKNSDNTIYSITAEQLEDIKVRCCYVKYKLNSKETHVSSDEIQYKLSADRIVNVSAEARWKSCEILFGGLEDEEVVDPTVSIQSAIINCLENCPMEMRRRVIQNILICGGTAEFRGFTTRLAIELDVALSRNEKLKNLKSLVKFGVPHFSPMTRQWVGGSIFGSLEGCEEYTAAAYKGGEKVKDWANRLDNTLYLDESICDNLLPEASLFEETKLKEEEKRTAD